MEEEIKKRKFHQWTRSDGLRVVLWLHALFLIGTPPALYLCLRTEEDEAYGMGARLT